MKTNKNIEPLDQFIDKEYGNIGTDSSEEFEQGFDEFKIGFLVQQARL
jgi:HTH-type transcriptional regulator/antitoxin HipB